MTSLTLFCFSALPLLMMYRVIPLSALPELRPFRDHGYDRGKERPWRWPA